MDAQSPKSAPTRRHGILSLPHPLLRKHQVVSFRRSTKWRRCVVSRRQNWDERAAGRPVFNSIRINRIDRALCSRVSVRGATSLTSSTSLCQLAGTQCTAFHSPTARPVRSMPAFYSKKTSIKQNMGFPLDRKSKRNLGLKSNCY